METIKGDRRRRRRRKARKEGRTEEDEDEEDGKTGLGITLFRGPTTMDNAFLTGGHYPAVISAGMRCNILEFLRANRN